MIISASRRTDIPAFYSGWLLNRLREGRVLVPNPWNADMLGSVRLSPANVDCIVFWTKNPEPMLGALDALDAMGYRYYFTFTLTAYGADLERSLPPKAQVAETFLRLSERLGPERVDWRFDPVAVGGRYTLQWHLDAFGELCRRLRGATERCLMNFIKSYSHLGPRWREMDDALILDTAKKLAGVAAEHGMPLFNCTEKWDLRDQGIGFSACIDRAKIERITGSPMLVKKDPGQPPICRCAQSVDIGMYDTCPHGCAYCYGTTSAQKTRRRVAAHDPASPMLTGRPTGLETLTDRTRPSQKNQQLSLL